MNATSAISVQDLPPELLDHIFSYLTPCYTSSTPKADLSACTLVTRQWRDLAQSHLFHSFYFAFDCSREDETWSPDTQYPHVHNAQAGISPVPLRPPVFSLPMLYRFLSQHQHIGRYIRTANFSTTSNGTSPVDLIHVKFQLFMEVMKLLPLMEALLLDGILICLSSPEDTPHYDWQPIPLTRLSLDLEISNFYFGHNANSIVTHYARRLLSCFQGVKQLSVANYKGGCLGLICESSKYQLRSITLKDCNIYDTPYHISLDSSASEVTHLKLYWKYAFNWRLDPSVAVALVAFFNAIADRLQSLELSFLVHRCKTNSTYVCVFWVA